MADTGIFATTAEVQAKVGANMSATYNVEAYINQFMAEAESYINAECRYNYSDAYAGLNADVKAILKMVASSLAAMDVIQADPSGVSRAEYETRLDVLNYKVEIGIKQLKEKQTQTFINNA